MKKFKVTLQPSGKRGAIHEEKTILGTSRELGVQIESLCGGEKTWGKCKAKLLEGELSSFTDEQAKMH